MNGKALAKLPPPGSYVEIKRTWKNGDTVALVLPKQLHEEPLPDNPRRVALMWWPLVLAGDLGPEQRRRGRGLSNDVPVLVAAETPVAAWLKPVAGQPGDFQSTGVGRDKDVQFVPFYRLHERTYAVYWDTFTPAEWGKKSQEYAAQQAREETLQLATVGLAQPGQMQAERDYNMHSSAPEDSSVEQTMGRYGRRGTKWFSFDLPVDPEHPLTLVCTYNADEWRKRDLCRAGGRPESRGRNHSGARRNEVLRCRVQNSSQPGGGQEKSHCPLRGHRGQRNRRAMYGIPHLAH